MKYLFKRNTLLLLGLIALHSCKKSPVNTNMSADPVNTPPAPTGNTPGTIVKGTDPATAATQGFFLDNSWQPKTFTIPTNTQSASKPADGGIYVSIDLSRIVAKTSPYLFGNNANTYMGPIVSEPILIDNLKALSPNILRFPGGSLADKYFWNATFNQNPADVPLQLLDLNGTASAAGYWYGMGTPDWTISLDEYYATLLQTGSTGLVTVNYGYARYGTGPSPVQNAAHLAADWVRYDKGRTKYWEIGNENYGNWEAGYRINTSANQDGQPQVITATLYGQHFKVFADSMRAAASQIGATIKIGLVLTEVDDSNNSSGISGWNAGVLSAAGQAPDFFVVHNYYTPYNQNSTADVILNTPVSGSAATADWVKNSVSGAGLAQKPIAMDEYNISAVGSSQMVSQIAGVHGVMVLGELLKNQLSMASRWDLANAWDNGDDMGIFNNSSGGSEPGAATWSPRPAFYYMYYFQHYFGDRMVASSVTGTSDILSYASSFSSGQAADILVNKSSVPHTVTLVISNFLPGNNYYYYELKGGADGTFSRKVLINGNGTSAASGGPDNFTAIPANTAPINGGITVTVPGYGVVYLVADKSN
jgi:hypothetical protein